MKIDNYTISFEVSEKDLNKFNLAIASADLDADEEFKKWISQLTEIALRKVSGEKIKGAFNSFKNTFSDDNIATSRIDRWANNKKGANYGIIKAYFQSEERHEGYAMRDEMEEFYNSNSANISPFLGNFRMMCCDSAFSAYIFNYDKVTKQVTLNEKYANYIIERKDDFYKI